MGFVVFCLSEVTFTFKYGFCRYEQSMADIKKSYTNHKTPFTGQGIFRAIANLAQSGKCLNLRKNEVEIFEGFGFGSEKPPPKPHFTDMWGVKC